MTAPRVATGARKLVYMSEDDCAGGLGGHTCVLDFAGSSEFMQVLDCWASGLVHVTAHCAGMQPKS